MNDEIAQVAKKVGGILVQWWLKIAILAEYPQWQNNIAYIFAPQYLGNIANQQWRS